MAIFWRFKALDAESVGQLPLPKVKDLGSVPGMRIFFIYLVKGNPIIIRNPSYDPKRIPSLKGLNCNSLLK